MEGQRRLKAARVLLVGVGGLGSPAALYLAAAGVGTLGLVDHDVVEYSNLQRQVLHGTGSVGRSKLASASERLRDVNPHVALELHDTHLSSDTALDIIGRYDLVVDGSDNFPTRYLVNDACVLLGRPNVYGSIYRFEGQAAVFWAARGPCYRCLYREPPPPELVPSCEEGGVLGVLPGVIGAIQATEAVKLLLGVGDSLVGRLLLFDALAMTFRTLQLDKDPSCPACGTDPTITRLIDYDAFCGVQTPGKGASDVDLELTAVELRDALAAGRAITLLDVRESWEFDICHIDGSRLVPLGALPGALAGIPADAEVVTICHTGRRSLQAAFFLREAGITSARSLRGGVVGWAADVDPSMPSY